MELPENKPVGIHTCGFPTDPYPQEPHRYPELVLSLRLLKCPARAARSHELLRGILHAGMASLVQKHILMTSCDPQVTEHQPSLENPGRDPYHWYPGSRQWSWTFLEQLITINRRSRWSFGGWRALITRVPSESRHNARTGTYAKFV